MSACLLVLSVFICNRKRDKGHNVAHKFRGFAKLKQFQTFKKMDRAHAIHPPTPLSIFFGKVTMSKFCDEMVAGIAASFIY